MAIRSAAAYIINEEHDGFVAVDLIEIDDHDLSSWEFVDQNDDIFAEHIQDLDEEEDEDDDDDDVTREENEGNTEDLVHFEEKMVESPPSVASLAEAVEIHRQIAADYDLAVKFEKYGDNFDDYEKEVDEEVEEEDDDDVADYDDELIPYMVNDKLGRQRMRKLGKRSCPKLVKSKRLTYNYTRSGCVRGKHGLGLKHSLI